MKQYRRPRRFSIRREHESESDKRRFDFHKYRRKDPIKTRYILWLFIVFAVVIFLVRYLNYIAR